MINDEHTIHKFGRSLLMELSLRILQQAHSFKTLVEKSTVKRQYRAFFLMNILQTFCGIGRTILKKPELKKFRIHLDHKKIFTGFIVNFQRNIGIRKTIANLMPKRRIRALSNRRGRRGAGSQQQTSYHHAETRNNAATNFHFHASSVTAESLLHKTKIIIIDAMNSLLKKYSPIITKNFVNLLPFFVTFFIYALTTFPTVQSEDSGELITSALALDIAHPPGYPLFVLVGKIFSTLLPFGDPAWRINIMSGFFGALTAQILYTIIKKKTTNDLIAFGMALFYAFSNIIWGQSNRAEVYTLNTFCIVLVIYLLMRWNDEKRSLWIFLAALVFGLGVGDHHTILLAAPAIFIYILIKNRRVIINPKIVLPCVGLLALGLSVYAYLPIRTYLAPYDNPAFIEHDALYSWDKFIGFVNRKIYGGTVNINSEQATQEANVNHLPTWLIDIKDTAANYGKMFINSNARSLIPLLKIISQNFFYLPLFLFLPGLYFLFKKDPQWAAFITLLFVCFTTLLNVFAPINKDINDALAFSTQPFMMPAILVLTIIISEGLAWLTTQWQSKKVVLAFSILCLVPAGAALANNFTANNESNNYLAHDFNKLALESLPPNAYLLSDGKDNMTFPFYYLRKIEKLRPDIRLEIDYSTAVPDEALLKDRLAKNNGKAIFIDLLPPNYASMHLKPYNFVYQYGDDASLPPPSLKNPIVRGIRDEMDISDTRLKMLYYIKTGILEKDPALKQKAFDAVINAPGDNGYYINIIGDYAYTMHDYDTAKKAYQKSNNGYGLQKINDVLNNPDHVEDNPTQTGMN